MVGLRLAPLPLVALFGCSGAEANTDGDSVDTSSFAGIAMNAFELLLFLLWIVALLSKQKRSAHKKGEDVTSLHPDKVANGKTTRTARNVADNSQVCSKPMQWTTPSTPKRTPEKIAIVDIVRSGCMDELPSKLYEACEKAWKENGQEQSSELVEAALLACISRRRAAFALDVFDHVKEFVGSGSGGLWSVVLYAATESGCYELGPSCFERLQSFQTPGPYDYVNLVRCFAQMRDRAGLRTLLRSLRDQGARFDSKTLSKAIAACVVNKAFDFADMILYSGVSSEGLEVKACNTLMMSYLQRRRPADCFNLRDLMKAQNVEPNAKTFSLLLEAGGRCRDHSEVREAIKNLHVFDASFPIINCTTVIRSLTEAGMVGEAEEVLHLLQAHGATPYEGCYETVLHGYRNAGRVKEALALLARMKKDKLM